MYDTEFCGSIISHRHTGHAVEANFNVSDADLIREFEKILRKNPSYMHKSYKIDISVDRNAKTISIKIYDDEDVRSEFTLNDKDVLVLLGSDHRRPFVLTHEEFYRFFYFD